MHCGCLTLVSSRRRFEVSPFPSFFPRSALPMFKRTFPNMAHAHVGLLLANVCDLSNQRALYCCSDSFVLRGTPRLRFEILIDQFQRHEQPRPLPGSFPDLLMTTWNSPGCTNIMDGGNLALSPCDLFIHAQFKSNMI